MLCVVLASGAAFGMAAQAALHHFALDFGSIYGGLFVDRTASARAAAAWWAWWVVAVAAVFVGPLSAALARNLVDNWWLMRGLRLAATAAIVLGLAAIGGLSPAPSALASTTNAAFGLLVVAGSTVLAGLGALVLGGILPKAEPVRVCLPASGRVARAHPPRGGGSIRSGLPFLLFRQRNALVPGPFSIARLGIVAALAVAVFAAVSVLGGATVLLNSVAPGAVRELAASTIPSVGARSHARALVLALLPAEERRPVVMPPVVMLDAPPVKPSEAPEAQRTIAATVGYGGPIPESELTFSKGYARRRAAQLAATMTSPPSIPQLTAAINIKRIRAASLRFTQQERRVNRAAADNRYFADNRAWAENRSWENRSWGDNRRASRHSRALDRNADHHARYGDYGYNGHDRHSRRARHRGYDHYGDGRGYDHYGDSRFAGADQPYRRF